MSNMSKFQEIYQSKLIPLEISFHYFLFLNDKI